MSNDYFGSSFSKMGFILATLGSSIGLGHIWKFPYMAGVNGGAAFVLIFLLLSVIIGASMLIADMIIGNRGRKNAYDSFQTLDPTKPKLWKWAGITIIGGPLVLSYYCIILGWVVYYLFVISFNLPTNVEQSKAIFDTLQHSFLYQLICFAIIVFITTYCIAGGVKSGVEKLNFILMPLLFIIFIGLLFYAISMDHFKDGVKFMFKFEPDKITGDVLVAAMGQTFFSLSLGVGTIITYAAVAESNQNLFSSAMWVVIPGILISLIAGVIIFTFVFEYNAEPSAGPGLVFITLPVVFHNMGGVGVLISILFMVGLLFAGISSTVSLLEPSVKWLEEHTSKNRNFLTWVLGFIVFILGSIIILSINGHITFKAFNKDLFDLADYISSNIIMTLGGLASTLFLGYVIPKAKVREWTSSFFGPAIFSAWYFSLRYLAPIAILIIFFYKLKG